MEHRYFLYSRQWAPVKKWFLEYTNRLPCSLCAVNPCRKLPCPHVSWRGCVFNCLCLQLTKKQKSLKYHQYLWRNTDLGHLQIVLMFISHTSFFRNLRTIKRYFQASAERHCEVCSQKHYINTLKCFQIISQEVHRSMRSSSTAVRTGLPNHCASHVSWFLSWVSNYLWFSRSDSLCPYLYEPREFWCCCTLLQQADLHILMFV